MNTPHTIPYPLPCMETPDNCNFRVASHRQGDSFDSDCLNANYLVYCRSGHVRISSTLFHDEILCGYGLHNFCKRFLGDTPSNIRKALAENHLLQIPETAAAGTADILLQGAAWVVRSCRVLAWGEGAGLYVSTCKAVRQYV